MLFSKILNICGNELVHFCIDLETNFMEYQLNTQFSKSPGQTRVGVDASCMSCLTANSR